MKYSRLSSFKYFSIQVQRTISGIRERQLELFENHLLMESHAGDGIEMLGALDSGSVDEGGGENYFKPLESWFESKEKSIQNLTGHLEDICKQMAELNSISSVEKNSERF